MNSRDFIAPIITPDINSDLTGQCILPLPWIVQGSKYPPRMATYKPLVNGEEAFAAVHHAIFNAQKSVDIICWGFQPSMYFIRDGNHPSIGELLVEIARKRKVEVRILGWQCPLNAAGVLGEANLPGLGGIKDRAGQTSTDDQYASDCDWYQRYYLWSESDYNPQAMGELTDGFTYGAQILPERLEAIRDERLKAGKPLFVGRGFSVLERAEMMHRARFTAEDKGLSLSTVGIFGVGPTHHQKTVLVDYELPGSAVGFVMGHNMLDEYWDTDAHSARVRENPPPPNMGPRGRLPRQDISCRLTGPLLEYLHENFATAWQRAAGEDLLTRRNATGVGKKIYMRSAHGTPLMAQLLRTQAQEKYGDQRGLKEIQTCYLQAIKNATQFIYIENQYFRWPPLAEAILSTVAEQTKDGRDMEEHGSLHLFIVTNVTDEGIGSGTMNTWRMLDILGRQDTISGVVKQLKINQLAQETLDSTADERGLDIIDERVEQKLADFRKGVEEIKTSKVLSEKRPGLKVHVCSLVAPDSPPDNWMPVYIHSKLMIVNDVFTTHGSANINTRSMMIDSEMNIAHDWASVTQELRRRLWKLHTNGMGDQDDAEVAFDAWEDVLNQNEGNQDKNLSPIASLIKFDYINYNVTDLD